MSNKLITILNVKSYIPSDLECWVRWYIHFIRPDEIYIIEDNSLYDIYPLLDYPNIKILKSEELPKSKSVQQLSNYNTLLKTIIKPNVGDIIITPDDDEFWWYDTQKYQSFKECCNDILKEKDGICVPTILMGSKDVPKTRNNYIETFKYRISTQTKSEKKFVMKWNKRQIQHIHRGLHTYKNINESDEVNDIYGSVVYDYPLRLYHYRLTTEEEYTMKMSRCINDNVRNGRRMYAKNDMRTFLKSYYGIDDWFDIEDFTVYNQFKKI